MDNDTVEIDQEDFPTPVTPEEKVMVSSLNREVVVRGVTLLERDRIFRAAREEEVNDYSGTAYMLSICVRSKKGKQVYTPRQWDVWGGANREDSEKLADMALTMIGLRAKEAEKK